MFGVAFLYAGSLWFLTWRKDRLPTPVFLGFPGGSDGQESWRLFMVQQQPFSNAITEIKSTLEGTNSRITEAEDRISEVEDRMVEINETERKKELKETRTTSETSGTMLKATTFES